MALSGNFRSDLRTYARRKFVTIVTMSVRFITIVIIFIIVMFVKLKILPIEDMCRG
jgi:hypothetical protein